MGVTGAQVNEIARRRLATEEVFFFFFFFSFFSSSSSSSSSSFSSSFFLPFPYFNHTILLKVKLIEINEDPPQEGAERPQEEKEDKEKEKPEWRLVEDHEIPREMINAGCSVLFLSFLFLFFIYFFKH